MTFRTSDATPSARHRSTNAGVASIRQTFKSRASKIAASRPIALPIRAALLSSGARVSG